MKVVMIRTNISEVRGATMVRFLNWLNKDIANIVEFQHYIEIKDVVYMAVKVEKELRWKGSARQSGYLGSSFS
jgi:hypothetical protein